LEQEQERLASKGYRVIAVAIRKNMQSIPTDLKKNELELLGIIGLEDPPREEATEAVKICSKAGIRVVMITCLLENSLKQSVMKSLRKILVGDS